MIFQVKHLSFNLFDKIDQKGMNFDHDFCYSFSFSSSLFFLGGKRKGEKNNQSCVFKSHAFLLDRIFYVKVVKDLLVVSN